MASPRSRTEVAAKPSAQKRRIAASNATSSSNSRGRGTSDPFGWNYIGADAIEHFTRWQATALTAGRTRRLVWKMRVCHFVAYDLITANRDGASQTMVTRFVWFC